MSRFIDFSCFLKSGIAVFTFQTAVISSGLYCLTSGEKCLPSALLVIARPSPSLYGHTCSVLLAPSCGRILKSVCCLSILWSLVVCWTTSLLLPRGRSLLGPPSQASFLRMLSWCGLQSPLGPPLGARTRGVGRRVEGCVGEACEALAVPLGLHRRSVPSGSWPGLPVESLTRLIGSLSSSYVPL